MKTTCMLLRYSFAWILFFSIYPCHALWGQKKQPSLPAIASMPDDSLKVLALLQFGEQYELSEPDSASYYYQKALNLARKIKYLRGEAVYASYAIVLLNNEGKYSEALKLTQGALRTFQSGVGTQRDLAVGLINVANEWQYLGDLQAAASSYLQAADIATSIPDEFLQRICFNNLASIFSELKSHQKTITYAGRALLLAEKMKDDYARASSMINLATGTAEEGRLSEALILYDSVQQIGQRTGDQILILDGLNGKGEMYTRQKRGDSAVYFYNVLLTEALKTDATPYLMFGYSGLGKACWLLGRKEEGLQQMLKAIKLADSMEALIEKKNFLLAVAEMQESIGETGLALFYRKQYETTSDSLLSQSRQRDIVLAEARYQAKEREQKISGQEAQLKKRKGQIMVLVSFLLVILLTGWLAYRNFMQKRMLQQQEIEDLEKEKLLLASQALVRGQEAERSRLARDLHDGLGGMLSGIKLSLSAMKGNMILTETNALLFTATLEKLDETIGEMRRVAHSMMPEALIRLGLGQAIQDICSNIQSTGKLNISFQQLGISERQPADIEIVIYRIVQELLNNIIKHAKATEVLVQISSQPPLLTLTIEDNGKGFDVEQKEINDGAGLSNVRSRVDYLKGRIDIQSVPGKGSSVFIEMPLNDEP